MRMACARWHSRLDLFGKTASLSAGAPGANGSTIVFLVERLRGECEVGRFDMLRTRNLLDHE